MAARRCRFPNQLGPAHNPPSRAFLFCAEVELLKTPGEQAVAPLLDAAELTTSDEKPAQVARGDSRILGHRRVSPARRSSSQTRPWFASHGGRGGALALASIARRCLAQVLT